MRGLLFLFSERTKKKKHKAKQRCSQFSFIVGVFFEKFTVRTTQSRRRTDEGIDMFGFVPYKSFEKKMLCIGALKNQVISGNSSDAGAHFAPLEQKSSKHVLTQ